MGRLKMEGHIKWDSTGAVLGLVFSLTDDGIEIIQMIETQKGLQEYLLQGSPWMQKKSWQAGGQCITCLVEVLGSRLGRANHLHKYIT